MSTMTGSTEQRLSNGCRLLLDPAVPVQQQALRDGDYDRFAREVALRFLPRGGTFLDIGANVGLWACPLGVAARARGARGYAFEPVPATHARLVENLRLNGLSEIVTAEPLGLGAEPGRLEFHIEPGGPTNNAVGANMMTGGDQQYVQEHGWTQAQAEVVTLSDWAATRGLQRCDVIKIDVEGAEPLVLEGGREFLRATRPAIFGEFNPYWMSNVGKTFADVIQWFRGWNYYFYREVGRAFVPLTPELHGTPGGAMPSYLLLPREKQTFLGA